MRIFQVADVGAPLHRSMKVFTRVFPVTSLKKRLFGGENQQFNLDADQELNHFFLKKKIQLTFLGKFLSPEEGIKEIIFPYIPQLTSRRRKILDGENLLLAKLLTKFSSELGVNFTFAPIDDYCKSEASSLSF